jgi:enolase
MTDFKISKINARWILDSRGNPTVESDVFSGNKYARASVPSGASTGLLEALELRDEGSDFLGKHVTKAVSNVNNIIAKKLVGLDVREQRNIDNEMISIDKTNNKKNLGANAILSVSLAVAKLAAILLERPLFKYIYDISHTKSREDYLMPLPCCNILNGGEHAGNNLAIQEFMILPLGAPSFSEAIKSVAEVYQTLKKLLLKKYGKIAINVGDEGGFAPNLNYTTEALDVIVQGIEEAGFSMNKDFYLGLDAAASEFFKNNKYTIDGKILSDAELLDYYLDLIKRYSFIKSIEDPFEQKAFESFKELTLKIKNDVQIVDDDLTVTNIQILKKAVKENAGNALLLKVNQIGTLSESIDACKLAFDSNFNVMTSHRSGETEEIFIADLSVGLCSGQIKSGATCRSERTCKYNQLLRIEEILGSNAHYPNKLNSWKKYQ